MKQIKLLKEKLKQVQEDLEVCRRHEDNNSPTYHYVLGKQEVLEELIKELTNNENMKKEIKIAILLMGIFDLGLLIGLGVGLTH